MRVLPLLMGATPSQLLPEIALEELRGVGSSIHNPANAIDTVTDPQDNLTRDTAHTGTHPSGWRPDGGSTGGRKT